MNDLISRQAAIDAIGKKQGSVFDRDEEIDTTALYVYSECKAIIKDLPSVQPDVPDTNVGELISRQAAIDALQKEINKGIPPFDDVMGSIRCGVRLARNIIEDLPSVQPKIIRCKDCKHWMMGKTTKNYPNPYICELHSFMHGFERSALPEDYCSWGELRGEQDG